MIKLSRKLLALGVVTGLLLLPAACQPKPAVPAATGKQSPSKPGTHDHSHDEGPHDGVVVEWGEEEFHAEFTVDHDTKTATIYVLDEHAKNAPKIEPAKLTKITLTITNVTPPLTLELKFDPAKTDSKGIAFTATHDQFGKKMDFQGNISGTVNGKPYSRDFKEGGHDAGHDKKKTGLLKDHPGGVHVAFAQGRYYAEAIIHKGGSVHLFLFGKDLAKVVEADAHVVTAYIRAVGDNEFQSFEFKPDPLPGDERGNTSRFAGIVPAELRGKPLEITIPALKLAGERYHLAFRTLDHAGGGEHAMSMPAKTEADEEQRLYLRPAGLYTAADIEANGNMTASARFKDFKSVHDLKPQPGDKICPVTLTKANPECAWVVGGKKYEFCCPPCVDEFVKLAKADPTAVKAPEEYVKK